MPEENPNDWFVSYCGENAMRDAMRVASLMVAAGIPFRFERRDCAFTIRVPLQYAQRLGRCALPRKMDHALHSLPTGSPQHKRAFRIRAQLRLR